MLILVITATTVSAIRAADPFPAGWQAISPRDEIRPGFAFAPKGGPAGSGSFIITAGNSPGHQGWFQKPFDVVGGKTYEFRAVRKTENIEVPRRSVMARIVWRDVRGKAVLADVPEGRENDKGPIPLAEPEHPLDGVTSNDGWTTVSGTYRAPKRAAQAIVELHLQWAPGGRVEWSNIHFGQTTPLTKRIVRLAAVHYVPSGRSMRRNCEEYAPFVAEAAEKKADLVVLGETVPYVRVGMKPHETAEPIPGPTTTYFGDLARRHNLYIVLSLYERAAEVVYNTAVLLGTDGKVAGTYRKICLPHSEVEAGVTPGNSYPVFETRFGKVGMMVCYDGFFPEVARELTNRGAEVIAWPVWGCNPLLGQARACENHVYVVSSTYTDPKTDWMISAVFDHSGKPLEKASKWGEVVVAEVDLNARHFWRNNLGDFRAMAQRHRPPPVPEGSGHAREHVVVYRESGRFGGWPANHGIWSWGDEILVGFSAGSYKDLGTRHHIDREKPEYHWLARSRNGGRSWTIEDPSGGGVLVPMGKALHGIAPPDSKAKPWQECPGGIDFTHPDFALTVRMTDANAGPARFCFSYDRGRTWQGPYRLPNFDQPGIAARTDYIVNGKHDCSLFLTAAKRNGREGRPLCVRTVDGGKSWKLVGWIGPEPQGYAIMPSTVRLGEHELLSAIRCRNGKNGWIELYRSLDDGAQWKHESTPVPDTGGGNPASMIRLKDGRVCLTYGVRAAPFGIRARLSNDAGKSWGNEIMLRDDGGGHDVGYPRSIQRPDGKVVTVYYFHDTPRSERYIAATIWDPNQLSR
jgi:predicted amidohydrolase